MWAALDEMKSAPLNFGSSVFQVPDEEKKDSLKAKIPSNHEVGIPEFLVALSIFSWVGTLGRKTDYWYAY